MKKILLVVLFTFANHSYADNYRGVYRCFSSGVQWDSATPCPDAAKPVINGMDFNNYRMPDEKKINPYRNGARPSVFSIKERYKQYRQDVRFNNARSSDQSYLNARLAELDRLEQIEINGN